MPIARNRFLSHTLIGYIAFAGFASLLLLFLWFTFMGKKTLMDIEKEKAQLVGSLFAQKIGLNLYLGFDNKIEKILHQLVTQPDIEAAELTIDHRKPLVVGTVDPDNTFHIVLPVYDPQHYKILAKLNLYYSSRHYRTLLANLRRMLFIYLSVSGTLYLALLFLIREKLRPLRILAERLSGYRAGDELDIVTDTPYVELRQIESAVAKMHKKVSQYIRLQREMNSILAEKVAEKTREIQHQLYTDSLTGLPNRQALSRDLDETSEGLLILLNIDDFAEINDLYGPDKGDEILKSLAGKLQSLRIGEVYRTSGDEFVILHPDPVTFNEAGRLISRLRQQIETEKFDIEEGQIDLRVTIGATFHAPLRIVHADMAYKTAKKRRLPFEFFSEHWNLEESFRENLHWIGELKSALNEGRLRTYAQPIYDVRHGRIKGYEMLMRLIDRQGRVNPPARFLSLARKSHYYPRMTRSVIEQSCSFFSRHGEWSFSINLSVEDILNKQTVQFIKQCLLYYDVAPRVIFEILESENIEYFPEVDYFIQDVKKLGAKVAIDDFGSGYSNFSYLANLNVDFIKIDGSLIKEIDIDHHARSIVETIVLFARKLGIETVAEFVSSRQIYETASEIGIDYVQGYYIGKPVPLEQIEKNRATPLP